MEYYSKIQLRAFAAQNGTVIGVLWILSFALCIACIRDSNALLGLMGELIGLSSPFVAVRLGRFYARMTDEGSLRFGKAFLYTILVYGYASLLLAAAQFIYFNWIDPGLTLFQTGLFGEQKNSIISALQEQYPDQNIHEALDELYAMSAIDLTMQMLWTNVMLGVILSLPTALFTMKRTGRKK